MLLDKEQCIDDHSKETQDISFNRVLDRPLLEMAEVLEGIAEGIQEIPQYMGWDGVAEHVVYEAAYASVMCDNIIAGMRTSQTDNECKDARIEPSELRLTAPVRESILAPFEKMYSSLQEISESLFKGWRKNPSKRRHILNGEKYQALHCTPNSVRTPGSKVYVSAQDVGEVMPNFMKIFSKFLLARCSVIGILILILLTGSISMVFDYLEPHILPVYKISTAVVNTGDTPPMVGNLVESKAHSEQLDGDVANEDGLNHNKHSIADFVPSDGYAKWAYHGLELWVYVVVNLVCWFKLLAMMLDMVYFSFPVLREMLKNTLIGLKLVSTVAYDAVESLNTPKLNYIWISKAKFVRSIAEELHKVKPSYQVPEDFLKRIETEGFETLEDFRKAASIEVMADWYNIGLPSQVSCF